MRGRAGPWKRTVLLDALKKLFGRILHRQKPGRKTGLKQN